MGVLQTRVAAVSEEATTTVSNRLRLVENETQRFGVDDQFDDDRRVHQAK